MAGNSAITHRKLAFSAQILLRILAVVASSFAAWLMITDVDVEDVYGIQSDARYEYISAFRFFVLANLIAIGFLVVSLLVILFLRKKPLHPKFYFFLFLLDLIIGDILLGGCAAATAVGVIGKYGNSHVGWIGVCDHFAKFCIRAALSIILSLFSVIVFIIVIIVSWHSRLPGETKDAAINSST